MCQYTSIYWCTHNLYSSDIIFIFIFFQIVYHFHRDVFSRIHSVPIHVHIPILNYM